METDFTEYLLVFNRFYEYSSIFYATFYFLINNCVNTFLLFSQAESLNMRMSLLCFDWDSRKKNTYLIKIEEDVSQKKC